MNFAEKTKHLLDLQGRKQTWLAEQIGVSKVVLHNKLKENRFDYKEMEKIKSLLGVETIADYRNVMDG